MKTTKIINLTETEIANENIIRIIDSCQFVDVPAGESRFITFAGSMNATINTSCGEEDTYEVEYFNACKLSVDGYHYYGMKLKNIATLNINIIIIPIINIRISHNMFYF